MVNCVVALQWALRAIPTHLLHPGWSLPAIPGHLAFLHADQLNQLNQSFDFHLLAAGVFCSNGICLVPRSCYQR